MRLQKRMMKILISWLLKKNLTRKNFGMIKQSKLHVSYSKISVYLLIELFRFFAVFIHTLLLKKMDFHIVKGFCPMLKACICENQNN